MSQNTQTKKLLISNSVSDKSGILNRLSSQYSDYLATYPGAQFGVVVATLLIIVSIAFFLVQNV